MTITVAIQMDHVANIDISADSTFVLALEAQKRGYKTLHYVPNKLVMQDGNILTKAGPLQVRREEGNHFNLGDAADLISGM